MSTPFVHRNLPRLLLQARESVMAHTRPSLREHGLSDQQWRVLRVLGEHGTVETGRVAREAFILGPSLTGVLSRMERDGLILRVADRSDGRRKMIGLNQCGEELAEVVVECSVRARLIAEHGLSPVEIETLREFLKRIIKNLSDH